MGTTNEPVAWLLQTKTAHQFTFKEPTTAPQGVFPVPLYTHPTKTLTDEEILKIADVGEWHKDEFAINFARAILKKASEQ